MSDSTLHIMVGGRIPVSLSGVEKTVVLRELLGSGGYGTCWRVTDAETGEPYTLKIIQNIMPGTVDAERVRLEAEVSIPSEHVVPVLGFSQWDPYTYFVVFKYYAAESLDRVLATAALTAAQKKQILKETLTGVADAHRCNVIHRDIKPGNILVGRDGHVKLIDFGVAKFKARPITVSRALIGTPPYIAPEVLIDGARVADARADIYSLGQVFYELVMGQNFWERKGWRQLGDIVDYLTSVPPPTEIIEMDGFACDFYENADAVLPRMVKINPAERFGSIDEVRRTLGEEVKEEATLKDPALDFPVLSVETGTNKGAKTVVNVADGGRLPLGRFDLAGNDDSISARHLEFSRSGRRYFVRDVGSKNGTLVQGNQLRPGDPPRELRHEDRIKVGDIFLRFAFVSEH